MSTQKGKYKDLAERVGALVDEKNQAYGNSFDDCGQFLKLLYPEGIPTDKYSDMLCIVRIFDKLKRIATKKDAFGESPYSDIVGYGLLGLEKDNRGLKTASPTATTPAELDANLERLAEQIEKLEKQEADDRASENETSSSTPVVPSPPCDICGKPVDNIPEPIVSTLSKGQKFAHETCFNQKLAEGKK